MLKECSLSQLNQFVGHKVSICTKDMKTNFVFQNFQWDSDDEDIILFDETETENRIYIPIDEIDSTNNIDPDLYCDVIDINYGEQRISVCSMEKKPLRPKCKKCGYVFSKWDTPWEVNQTAPFGSMFDGDLVSVKICNHCFDDMISNVISPKDGDMDE